MTQSFQVVKECSTECPYFDPDLKKCLKNTPNDGVKVQRCGCANAEFGKPLYSNNSRDVGFCKNCGHIVIWRGNNVYAHYHRFYSCGLPYFGGLCEYNTLSFKERVRIESEQQLAQKDLKAQVDAIPQLSEEAKKVVLELDKKAQNESEPIKEQDTTPSEEEILNEELKNMGFIDPPQSEEPKKMNARIKRKD